MSEARYVHRASLIFRWQAGYEFLISLVGVLPSASVKPPMSSAEEAFPNG